MHSISSLALAASLALVVGLVISPLPAAAQEVPKDVGQCVSTTITLLGTRLEGVTDSGTAVGYANGLFGISYETEEAVMNSRVGDVVELCLESIPEGCPPGDERGRFYSGKNERTGETWSLPDAGHMCGGA